MERVGRLVGQREVRRPRDREAAALGAEDDELEAEPAAVVVAQVAGVVPPLGEPVVRAVVARQLDGLRIRGRDRRCGRRRARSAAAAGGLARIGPEQAATRGRRHASRVGAALIGAPPRSRPRTPAAVSRRCVRGGPASTSSSSPEQAHRRRHEQRPDDGRVERDGDRHAEPERLDQHDVGERERAGDDDHDERRDWSRSGRSARGRGRRPRGCRRSGPRPPSCATAGTPRSPSTARTGRRTGSPAGVVSTNPSGWKPSGADRLPSWKIQTSAPNEATIDSVFMTSALSGRTTERSSTNSTR